MKYPRFALAWVLYWLGDGVSRVMNSADWLGRLYPVYNRLMVWSSQVQGPSDFGPWKTVHPDAA